MGLFLKLETFVYKNLVVPLQGKHTFDFVDNYYQKGQKVLDFGCGIGSNSKLFHSDDYIGVEVDESRIISSRIKYPNKRFEQISFISTEDDRIPFENDSFDLVFISLCLHHIDSATCKLLLKEFSRVLNHNGRIIGIEPCILSGKYFSNIFMNIIDAGDYILPIEEYKKIYTSESYDTEDIDIVKTFGYHLWQYTSKPNTNNSTVYLGSKTNYRKLIKPLHLTSLYGKWVLLLYLVYIIISPMIN